MGKKWEAGQKFDRDMFEIPSPHLRLGVLLLYFFTWLLGGLLLGIWFMEKGMAGLGTLVFIGACVPLVYLFFYCRKAERDDMSDPVRQAEIKRSNRLHALRVKLMDTESEAEAAALSKEIDEIENDPSEKRIYLGE